MSINVAGFTVYIADCSSYFLMKANFLRCTVLFKGLF